MLIFYEKGRLLVACGGGGASGWFSGNGGAGGGAGVAGSSGTGSSGSGGQSVGSGQLTSTGSFASGVTGGKVESCTTGDYYAGQGVSPCNDIGNSVKFRTFDGTEVSSSASI